MPEFIRWILYSFERATIRVLSVYRWVIFVLPIDDELGNRSENSHLGDNYTFREALNSDIESIIEVYPKEFFGLMPKKRRDNLVRSRFKSGCTGFILLNELGKVVGATWAIPAKSSATIEFDGNAFELVNTFVVPSERGTGLGSFLRSRVISEMAKKDFSYVISYVWRSRKASVRMNLSTGSRIFAEKKRINFLGFHGTYIAKFVDFSFGDLIGSVKMDCNRPVSLIFSASGVSSPVIDLS